MFVSNQESKKKNKRYLNTEENQFGTCRALLLTIAMKITVLLEYVRTVITSYNIYIRAPSAKFVSFYLLIKHKPK